VEIPTLDCETFLRDADRGMLDFRDPNTGMPPPSYQRRTIPISPQDQTFWIFLHSATFDPLRWVIMKSGTYYERTLEEGIEERSQGFAGA
jgi:hypothetical protein